MKHTTEYLFDKPRSAYEPNLTILASRRITDAKALLHKLAQERKVTPINKMQPLIERYEATEQALNWWKNILNEK